MNSGGSRDGRTVRGAELTERLAENRARQVELYGEPLALRVHRMVGALGVTQSRLAAAFGMSPAMLSQLVGARRVKIGDPAVLARMMLLDEHCARGAVPAGEVPALLESVRTATPRWGPPDRAEQAGTRTPAEPRHHDLRGEPGAPVPRPRPGPVSRPVPGWESRRPDRATLAAEALRGVVGPARLVAAAALLGPGFPELAELLRRAAVIR